MKTNILFLKKENISQKPSKSYVAALSLCVAVWQCCGVEVLPLFGVALLHARDAVFLCRITAAVSCFVAGLLHYCVAVGALLRHFVIILEPPTIPRRTVAQQNDKKKITPGIYLLDEVIITTSFFISLLYSVLVYPPVWISTMIRTRSGVSFSCIACTPGDIPCMLLLLPCQAGECECVRKACE